MGRTTILMNNIPKHRGKYHARFTARKANPGECDLVALSKLPTARKHQIWQSIKTKDPHKADALKVAAEIARMLGGEVVMTENEIEEFLK